MLSTPHLLVGAAIGSVVANPGIAFLSGITSHLILDIIPHADSDLLDEPDKGNIMPVDYIPVALDIIVGFLFVCYFAFSRAHASENLFSGAVGAIIPDIISGVPFWSPALRSLPLFKQFHVFHYWVGFKNNGRGKLVGVITQFITIVIATVVLMRP